MTPVDKKSEASNLNLLPCTCIKMELLLLQSAIEGKEVTNEFLQEVVDHINNIYKLIELEAHVSLLQTSIRYVRF